MGDKLAGTMAPMMITVPVSDMASSVRFYEAMCGPLDVLASGDDFALLAYAPARTMLYLERRESSPPVEFAMQLADAPSLAAVYQDWQAKGVPIMTPPMHWAGVGQCFVGVDPHGNRVRVVDLGERDPGCLLAGVCAPAPRSRR